MLEAVTALIDELEMSNYQVVEQVTAKSSYSSPRLNTPIWPGYNSSIMIQESDEQKVSLLIEQVSMMNESVYNNSELVALYTWDIASSATIKEA